MKKSKHDLGWYIAFGVLTFLFILVAPAVPVAKVVVGSIFSVRLSNYNQLDSSLESDTYKFRKDYSAMTNRETISFLSGDNLLKGYLYQSPSSDNLIVMVSRPNGLFRRSKRKTMESTSYSPMIPLMATVVTQDR